MNKIQISLSEKLEKLHFRGFKPSHERDFYFRTANVVTNTPTIPLFFCTYINYF